MDNDLNEEQFKDKLLFINLVRMFQAAAMQQMGKVMNPMTQEMEVDLEQAKLSIDMLDMIQKRTEGNLEEMEKTLLNDVLFELRMNYVEEADRQKDVGDEEAKETTSQSSEKSEETGTETPEEQQPNDIDTDGEAKKSKSQPAKPKVNKSTSPKEKGKTKAKRKKKE